MLVTSIFSFLCPRIVRLRAYCFAIVHPSVCLHKLNMKTKYFPITPKPLVIKLIFGMKAHLINTHLLVPRSSAKVKVKYQGHVSQKMGVWGAFVFHKHILSPSCFQKASLWVLKSGDCLVKR